MMESIIENSANTGASRVRKRRPGAWRTGVAIAVTCMLMPGPSAAHAAPGDESGNGALRVGVEYLPPPPGPTDVRLYTPESFDVFLAGQLAAQLGRSLSLVEAAEGSLRQGLQDGRFDVVLLRLGESDPLRSQEDVIASGFRSGASVAMRSDTHVKQWSDLSGKTVCASKGHSAVQAIAAGYGATLRIEETPAQSLMLVRTGACDAAIHDQALLAQLQARNDWRKFKATLPETAPTELAAVVSHENEALASQLRIAVEQVTPADRWSALAEKWAENVAFEVYLDQDAPDCH